MKNTQREIQASIMCGHLSGRTSSPNCASFDKDVPPRSDEVSTSTTYKTRHATQLKRLLSLFVTLVKFVTKMFKFCLNKIASN